MLALDLLIDQRYRVEQLVGRGGMAEVYRAVDTVAGRPVAVKLLRDVEGGDLDRFRVEVAALSRLDHPGVIKLLGCGAHEGVPYLVLELVAGPSLADALGDGPLGFDRSVGMARQLADALAHLHRLTVVHRDVKPANVLFDGDGRPRLSDFGTARLADIGGVTATGFIIGTIPYLAPEQVKGQGVDAPADVYALGLVVLECLTGARCYAGTWTEAALARLHRPPEIPAGLPAWLREVLAAMTALDPTRRPSAEAAAEAFDRRCAEPLCGATVELRAPVTASAVPAAVTTAAVDRTSTMRFAPAGPGARRSPAAHRRSRLAGLAAASVALAVPAWLLASNDPQSADAPPAPTPASTAASPASTSTTVVQLSSPAPHRAARHEGDQSAMSPDGLGGGGGGHGGDSGPDKHGPGKGGGGNGHGGGNGGGHDR